MYLQGDDASIPGVRYETPFDSPSARFGGGFQQAQGQLWGTPGSSSEFLKTPVSGDVSLEMYAIRSPSLKRQAMSTVSDGVISCGAAFSVTALWRACRLIPWTAR